MKGFVAVQLNGPERTGRYSSGRGPGGAATEVMRRDRVKSSRGPLSGTVTTGPNWAEL